MAIPFKRSRRITLALSKDGFFELCFESFCRDHKAKMAWKKMAAAQFLPWTSLVVVMIFQLVDAERDEGS